MGKIEIKSKLRPLLAICIALALLLPILAHAIPTNSPPRILILDESVIAGASSAEALAAAVAIPGCAVDVCTASNWYAIPATGAGGPTGFGFDQYRAIVVGDPQCQNGAAYVSAINALNATKTNWTPACTGNIIIEGVDNALHAFGNPTNGPGKTLYRGIAFAANDTNRTGFYYAMSCFYDYSMTSTTNALLVPHLTGFGTFKVINYGGTCFDAAHMVATHPVFTNAPPLTDAELSNWGCSTHEGFSVWPPSFVVLAIALTNGAYTATDGSNGIPYILVRGEGVKVISPIELGPSHATNDLGTDHTVCATISTNITPYIGVPVTFTISSGPNSVTNYTAVTGSNGVACFTYTGNGGLGVDYITAKFLNDLDQTITSGNVTKLWVAACVSVGCESVECLSDGVWSYKFCITNQSGGPLAALSLFNAPVGVSFSPAVFPFAPALGVGQSTNLAVTITGSSWLTNLCFKFGATTNLAVVNCSIPKCLALPSCCNRVITNTLTFVNTIGLVSTYNYSITLQNVTASPIKFVGFAAGQSCVTFLPPLLDLTLPAYGTNLLLPGQTRVLNLQVKRTAPCPGTNEFYLSTLDTNLVGCCSTKVKLPPARCVKVNLPVDKSYAVTNTPVLLRAAPMVSFNPCNFVWVKFYSGGTFLGEALPSTSGYELNVTAGFTAGSHFITAVAQLEDGFGGEGEVESSEPVELIVLAPGQPPGNEH